MILGLDLSSVNSGYAVVDFHPTSQDGSLTTESKDTYQEDLISFGNIIPNKVFSHSAKLQFIYEYVNGILTKYDIDVVVIEDQHFRINVDTLKLLSKICGVVMLAAQQAGCGVVLYPAPTIKKSFTGNGKAVKKDMIETAISKFNITEGIDDNVADSIGVACTYINKELKGEL